MVKRNVTSKLWKCMQIESYSSLSSSTYCKNTTFSARAFSLNWVFSWRRSYELTKFCPSCHRLSSDELKNFRRVCSWIKQRKKGKDREPTRTNLVVSGCPTTDPHSLFKRELGALYSVLFWITHGDQLLGIICSRFRCWGITCRAACNEYWNWAWKDLEMNFS